MNKLVSMFLRYAVILFAGLGNLFIFYKVFSPLTFYFSSFLLSLFGAVSTEYSVSLIIFNQTAIEIINACVAGSAYYLLFILGMSVPNIRTLKRAGLIMFSFISFLVLNSVRILIMGLIANTSYFESVHMLFWYLLSLVFIVGIWFLGVRLFSIKSIPVLSDLEYLVEQTKRTKRNTEHNKPCKKHAN